MEKYIYPILATTLLTFLMFHKRLLANRKTCCSKCNGNTRFLWSSSVSFARLKRRSTILEVPGIHCKSQSFFDFLEMILSAEEVVAV